MIIVRMSDRVPVKVGGIKFWVSPLSVAQKAALLEFKIQKGGEEVIDTTKRMFHAIKYAVKGAEGLKRPDDSDYSLEFDEDGTLKDETVEELFNLSQSGKLSVFCYGLMNGFKQDSGIEGVEVDLKGTVSVEKKESAQAL